MAHRAVNIFWRLLDSCYEKSFESVHRGFLFSHSNIANYNCSSSWGKLRIRSNKNESHHQFSDPQVYAVTTVLYRTLTFNECKEASEDLMKEIIEAKADLKSKGFKFNE